LGKNASVPQSTGLTLPAQNIGEVENSGFDFTLGYRSQIGEFKYNVGLNGGYAKNKILFWMRLQVLLNGNVLPEDR
jgi:hypothetical protein